MNIFACDDVIYGTVSPSVCCVSDSPSETSRFIEHMIHKIDINSLSLAKNTTIKSTRYGYGQRFTQCLPQCLPQCLLRHRVHHENTTHEV